MTIVQGEVVDPDAVRRLREAFGEVDVVPNLPIDSIPALSVVDRNSQEILFYAIDATSFSIVHLDSASRFEPNDGALIVVVRDAVAALDVAALLPGLAANLRFIIPDRPYETGFCVLQDGDLVVASIPRKGEMS